jgi:hypothetical protein
MTAAILTKHQSQGAKILEHIRRNPGCGVHDLYRYSNASWARIRECTTSEEEVIPSAKYDGVGWCFTERLERHYVMRNGRRHVTYYVRKIK